MSFGYSPLDPPLIEDFNLVIEPGQRVALVGQSGSGKSTVARLAAGLVRALAGPGVLRRRATDGAATHRDQRFAGRRRSGRIPLRRHDRARTSSMWDATLPQSRIVEACRDAAIADVIEARVGGYQAVLEEGGKNLSGGQRQRLEIARALVGEPTMLVLDEATSALDPLTESHIVEALRRRGCTLPHHRAPPEHDSRRRQDHRHAARQDRAAGHARGDEGRGRSVSGPDQPGMTQSLARQRLAEAGEPVALGQREATLLNDPSCAYYIVNGAADVFSVTVEDGRALEGRSYFATVAAGGAMFGMDPGRSHGSLFLALGTAGTQARRISCAQLEALARQPEMAAEIAAVVAGWIAAARSALTIDAADLDARDATSLLESGQLWTRLERFHETLGATVASATRRSVFDEAERLGDKAREAEAARDSAFDALGAVLARRSTDIPSVSGRVEPVLEASRLVAASLGLDLRAPADVAGDRALHDHVAAIASASGFRIRRVALRGTWWQSDAGALLGQTLQGAAVALLPRGPRSYVAVDVASRTEQRVTESTPRHWRRSRWLSIVRCPPGRRACASWYTLARAVSHPISGCS